MCMEDFSECECQCSCHRDPDLVKHCMPCCTTCPECGKNVTDLDLHIKNCHTYASGRRRPIARNSIPNEILLEWARRRNPKDGWYEDDAGVPGFIPEERPDLDTGSD